MDPRLDQMQKKRKNDRFGDDAPLSAVCPQGKSQLHHDRMTVLRKKASQQRHGGTTDDQSHSEGKGHRTYSRWTRVSGNQQDTDGAKANESRHSPGASHEDGNGCGNWCDSPASLVPMRLVITGQIVNPANIPAHGSWRKQIKEHPNQIMNDELPDGILKAQRAG